MNTATIRERVASEGPGLLRQWMKENGVSQVRLAELIGIKQASVWQWLESGARPKSHHREALEKLTSSAVPASSWMTSAEAELVDISPFRPLVPTGT